jgi:LuxR family maltose regulon positive regulatory protein
MLPSEFPFSTHNEYPSSPPGEFIQQATHTLLMTKLSIPPLSHEIISRPHLLTNLDAGMHHKLTLISASAGSGKTTLLSDWAGQRSWPVAWFSLEESDNEPTRFWRYMIAALQKIVPDTTDAHEPQINIEAMLATLLNTLLALQTDVALVLEDYHFIDNSRIHQTVEFFIEHLPPHIHLFISSRVNPPFALARLRSRSHLHEIAPHQLALSNQEVKYFLDKVMRLQVPESMIALLAQHTEGWITGIQLAGISLQHHPNTYDFINNFTGSTSFIFEYLAEEVLLQQSPAIQLFLLSTSVLNRLCDPLCAALTQTPAAQDVLAQLEQANLFIVPLDHHGYWYRYHHLFRDFLLRHLRQHYPQQLHHLHLQASIWYEQEQLFPEAIDHALAAEDLPRAARLLMHIEQTLIRHNEVATLRHWLDAFPEDVIHTFPSLCLLQAWLCMITGQKTDLIEAWLESAQHNPLHPQPIPAPPDLPLPSDTTTSMIATIHAHLYNIKGDIPHAITFVQQALRSLPQNDLFQRGIYELTLGSIYWLNEDIDEAHHTFVKAQRAGISTDNLYIQVFSLYGQETTCMARNHYHQAFSLLQTILHLAEERKECQSFWMTAGAYLDIGLLYYEWNNLPAALDAFEHGVALSVQWEHKLMHMYGNTLLARTYQALGDATTAHHIIQHTEQYVLYDSSYSWIVATAESHRLRLAILHNDTIPIDQWKPVSTCHYVHTLEQVTFARILLQRQNPQQALSLLQELQQHVCTIGQARVLTEVLLLQALSLQRLGKHEPATSMLQESLSHAQRSGYTRLFIDEGPACAQLLATLLSSPSSKLDDPLLSGYKKHLLALCDPKTPEHGIPIQEPCSTLLNTREAEITRLLARGLSNKDIAQTLCLAESTVKWYIKNIYSKLDVHNRAQVVIRAQELSLFS